MDTDRQKTGDIPDILEYISSYLPVVDNHALILQISTPLQRNEKMITYFKPEASQIEEAKSTAFSEDRLCNM